MATVPGTPDTTAQLPFAPTQADLLIAAGIMHQQGRFQQMAGDVTQMPGAMTPKERFNERIKSIDERNKEATRSTLRNVLEIDPVTPLKGK